MNGVVYCRVSSKEQIEGTSLESQELACREYARQHNVKILQTFVERGESAKFADRTQLLALIDFCKENKGQVPVLLVWKIDRFARNVGDHFNIKASLLKYGVRVVSVTEPIDTKPEGKLMETILAGFAQFDNDIRAMRTVQGMKRKIQEGIFPWKPPLGYKSVTASGEKKTKPDEPNQPAFGLVQRAWKEFATGAYTKAEIRRLLNTWGVQTAEGNPLNHQAVDSLLTNPYYAGILVDPWSKEECQGQHLAMVTPDEFAQVQRIICGRNRTVTHHKARTEFPLRGLVRCQQCRWHLTASFSRGRSQRYPYYFCANPKCRQRKSYPAQLLHANFETFLDGIAPKSELIEKLGHLVIEKAGELQTFWKTRGARREAELVRLNRQLHELIRMRTQSLITDEEFLAQKRVLSERKFSLEGTPIPGRIDGEHVRQQLSEITHPLTHLFETWEALPPSLQCRFGRLILPVGFVNAEARTAELGLLFTAFGQLADGNANGVSPVGKLWNQIWLEIQDFAGLIRESQGGAEASEEAVLEIAGE
jgi:site-specific DNA recombinase